ncbi:MAG: TIGR03618 family F420-dependent PPOX class oxidoreductase [Dehalococcoidia bacterium]
MPEMSPPERDAFLRQPRIAKLAILNADGSPSIVPLWFDWDGATARLFTTRSSRKVRRILAEPRVALSVETALTQDEAWVTIEGIASIKAEGGLQLAEKLAPRYYGEKKAAEILPAWRQVADWVVIEIKPVRIRSRAPEA